MNQKQTECQQAFQRYNTSKIYTIFNQVISIWCIFWQGTLFFLFFQKSENTSFFVCFFLGVCAYIFADFWNGFIHLFMDNWRKYWGFFWPLTANFHRHHIYPQYTPKPLFQVYYTETGSKIWLFVLLFFILILNSLFSEYLLLFFGFFSLFSSIAEVSHYLAHHPKKWFIHLLQKYHILLSPKAHITHHTKDNTSYAFLNGMTNPILDKIAHKYCKGYKNYADKDFIS